MRNHTSPLPILTIMSLESEAGHIKEIDDSPGSERLFTQHMSGTFEEIHPDGSKVVKIVGDNYEIVAGASNVSITGNVNLTVAGTVRELIKRRLSFRSRR